MARSKIEWTEYTWNVVTGCTPISPGCANCYAQRMAKRLAGRCGYPADDPFRVTLHPEKLEEPLHWKKPRRVFVCSMGDLFHPDVPYEFIDEVFAVMAVCSQHTFLVLTKRPERMHDYIHAPHTNNVVLKHFKRKPDRGERTWPLPNVWIGVTAENQARADERIPILLETPAVVRFVSCEPLLSAIDLSHWLTCACDEYWPGQGHHPECPTQKLHWCIVGGETGPGARPMHPDWVRSLRNQCQASGTPFFLKSWGDWTAEHRPEVSVDLTRLRANEQVAKADGGHYLFRCVGKKAAGRVLDGRTWDEYPKEA